MSYCDDCNEGLNAWELKSQAFVDKNRKRYCLKCWKSDLADDDMIERRFYSELLVSSDDDEQCTERERGAGGNRITYM